MHVQIYAQRQLLICRSLYFEKAFTNKKTTDDFTFNEENGIVTIKFTEEFSTGLEFIENKLLVIVKVVLLPNMNVYSTKVIKSSGNIIYDNNVVNAINIVKKFPDIPEGEKWLDYRVINLTFKSEQ